MKEFNVGEMITQKKMQLSKEVLIDVSFSMISMLVSAYVSQKVNDRDDTPQDFEVFFVKGERVITIDEMMIDVLGDKVIPCLGKHSHKLYDLTKIIQAELEQWDVECRGKGVFLA